MSDKPLNIGDTLSTGIQDIAALLPLLGTEQCERHVGSALDKGFLYAAAAPLSIFGSLGIVKVAFATWLATVTFPFYGGRWLEDAGFSTPGSVSSMVTIAKDTGRYGAEIAVERLLEDQHIDDPTLVKEFSWSDRRCGKIPGKPVADDSDSSHADNHEQDNYQGKAAIGVIKAWLSSWNVMLIFSSFISTALSITPYLYLMGGHWNNPLSWVFPILRSFGSLLCVVAIQLTLQLRIHRIANTSLEWLKIQRKHPEIEVEKDFISQPVLETRIRGYIYPQSKSFLPLYYQEKSPLSDVERQTLEALFVVDWYLILYQVILAIGIVILVTGYVGCFSLVGQTDVKNAPYIWFGLETTLSLLRILLWGMNPDWDDSEGLTMTLELRSLHDAAGSCFPPITSPYDKEELGLTEGGSSSSESFVVQSEAHFLSMATAWVGPLQRLDSNGITLFYSILTNNNTKQLYTTVHFMDSRTTLTFSADADVKTEDLEVFSSTLEPIPGTRATQITVGDCILKKIDTFLSTQLYQQVVDHSRLLNARLFGRQRFDNLCARWNLVTRPIRNEPVHSTVTTSLSGYDQKYINLKSLWMFKTQYSRARATLFEELAARDETIVTQDEAAFHYMIGFKRGTFYGEVLLLVETTILEIQLWHEEATLGVDDSQFGRQILPECIRAMQSRLAVENTWAMTRYDKYKWDRDAQEQLSLQWRLIERMLLRIRESEPFESGVEELREHFCRHWSNANRSYFGKMATHFNIIMPGTGSRLGKWLKNIARLEGASQKLDLILRLFVFRLKTILSSGFSAVCADYALWRTLTHVADSASWDPYIDLQAISKYTWEVLQCHPSSQSLAIELRAPFLHDEQQKGGKVTVIGIKDTGESLEGRGSNMLLGLSKPEQISTLIICFPWDLDDKARANLKRLILDTLTNSPGIICHCGMECDHRSEMSSSCEQVHCQCRAISANRQAWKKKAQSGLSFAYRVGFEAHDGGSVQSKGDHIRLFNNGRLFGLVYCPSSGEITITLSVQREAQPVRLTGTLILDVGKSWTNTTTYEVPARTSEGELHCVRVNMCFSDVPQGTGEIYIIGAWEIYGQVEMKWNAKKEPEKGDIAADSAGDGLPNLKESDEIQRTG